MLGLSFEKMALIVLIAGLIMGPHKLPLYAEKLAQFVRTIQNLTDTAKTRAATELGPNFDPAEWSKLDPRSYDPRRIIRETLTNQEPQDPPRKNNNEILINGENDQRKAKVILTPIKPGPPVAQGGWQQTLLDRLTTPTSPLPSTLATNVSATPPGQTGLPHEPDRR